MNIKSQLFTSSERYLQVSASVFDDGWMKLIKMNQVIFVAEGVFMYCSEKDVKDLFNKIQQNFSGAEMVCEVFSKKWLTGWRDRSMKAKLKRQLKFGESSLFSIGIEDSDEFEKWSTGIKFISDWSYLDTDEMRSHVTNWLRKKDSIRKIQWTVHYKFNNSSLVD